MSPVRGGTSVRVLGVVLCLLRCIYTVRAFACVGKCRSYGAQFAFICAYPGFHIGLCPHFTLGFAGVSPLQGSLSYWAFAVLCSLNVFGCVNGLLGSFVFLYLFDCDCVVCGIGGDCWGIDCCGRAMTPTGRYSCIAQGASPGLVIVTHLLSPFRGGTPAQACVVVVVYRPYRACWAYCRGAYLEGERGMFTKKLRTSPPRGRLVRSVSL